jgi:hypothetical protein
MLFKYCHKKKKKTISSKQTHNASQGHREARVNCTKTKISRKEEITKIRVEINEIKTNKTIQEVNEIQFFFLKKTKLAHLYLV